MKKRSLFRLFFAAFVAVFALQNLALAQAETPAFSVVAKGAWLGMDEATLRKARPKAVAQDSAAQDATLVLMELVDNGVVTQIGYEIDRRKGQPRRLVAATIFYWEPTAREVAELFLGDANTEDKQWSLEQTDGKKVRVEAEKETFELIFKLENEPKKN